MSFQMWVCHFRGRCVISVFSVISEAGCVISEAALSFETASEIMLSSGGVQLVGNNPLELSSERFIIFFFFYFFKSLYL